MRILLAEDEHQLSAALARGLREHAYAVDLAADGAEALRHAAVNQYDAIVLDIQMPKRDGIDVCRELRRRGSEVLVLMLTARDAVEDRIAGLDSGADDYLTKPFIFDELLARLRALLRRRGRVRATTLTVANLRIDTGEQIVRRGARSIPLTAKEYAFLEYLARNAGSVVSRSEIVEHVWDENHDPGANLVDVYVSRLRRKIDAGEPTALLHTRRGAGILLGEVTEREQVES
jgi:two-component system copper resistance phosphate regulon response regulator CusR